MRAYFSSCLLQGEHNHITGYCKKNPSITPIFASQIKALILQVYIHKYNHNFRPIQAKINWRKKKYLTPLSKLIVKPNKQ